MCERWDRFENFFSDMGKCGVGKTLDRINNDLGYSPENCRWATRKEQHRNTSKNLRITAFGETAPAIVFAEKFGINPFTLYDRLKKGWTTEAALTVSRTEGSHKTRKR